MPKCIPYESSLVLGQVIDVKKIEAFESIAKAESSTDDEEKKLNNLLKAKLEMENTIFQVKSLGIDVSSLKEELENMDNSIKHAASAVVHAQIDAYRPGGAVDRALKCADHEAHVECPASPIDFCRSNIKTLPLSNDSIVFDSKYFSFDHNEKTSHSNLSYLKTFISSSVKYLGRDRCNQITSAVAKQATSQIETRKFHIHSVWI